MEHNGRPSTTLFDVYLRLRPSSAVDRERFLDVEQVEGHAPTHITIKPPSHDNRKRAIEKFAFTRVFEEHAGQRELFETTGALQLVEGVLGARGREGRDGLLATLGVTGSGKSHTILGSKSQRGITQLTLDVLFQHTTPLLLDIDCSMTGFDSLCATDVSEAQLLSAAAFLDSLYAETGPSRGATPARGTTPALVRNSQLPLLSLHVPGAYPSTNSIGSSPPPAKTAGGSHDCLSSSLAKYEPAAPRTITPHIISRLFPDSEKRWNAQRFAKLTNSVQQDNSFLSAPVARRFAPRLSTLPTYPPVDDIEINIDNTAEYAIVVSMYEVHNDRIFDLLASTTLKTPQKRRALLFKSTEMSPDRKVVAGLKKVVCSDLEEALLVLETGLQERRVAGTGSNATSSRSHGFFCIEVKKRHRGSVPGPWTSSTLTIVDLAGSERARAAKTAGATLAEGGKINESLMYLGQCMQMQSDNANCSTPSLVPFRQCKLTELLFSNSLAQRGPMQKQQQKSIMVVNADPLGDFNATSQILRYSALAREVTVPRIPSVTSTILSGSTAVKSTGTASGRTTPSALQEELEHALVAITHLREELEVAQLRLEEETHRRRQAEASWKVAESRIEDVEAEIREEVWSEMEAKLAVEQRRWRAAREEELDAQDEHVGRKLDILTRGFSIYSDESADLDEEDKENIAGNAETEGHIDEDTKKANTRLPELEAENAELRTRLALMEREKGMRTPSKKMRVLKSRKWEGSGMGLEDE